MKRLPKPYWQSTDGGAVLYMGDCMEILPLLEAGSVGAVVTDPPYGMNWDTNSKRFTGGKGYHDKTSDRVHGDNTAFDPAPLLRFPKAILWGSNHYANRLPVGTTLVWLKKNESKFGAFLSDCEIAWQTGGHGAYVFHCVWDGCARETENQEHYHPTQKPVVLMEWCIEKVSKEGQTILDPFAGLGTTGVAAIRTGRRCILIEKELKYCAIAAKRLAEACCEGEGQFRFPEPDLFSTV